TTARPAVSRARFIASATTAACRSYARVTITASPRAEPTPSARGSGPPRPGAPRGGCWPTAAGEPDPEAAPTGSCPRASPPAARPEWVIRVDGSVRDRPQGTTNEDLPTGQIEIYATEIEVLSQAKELPVPVFGEPDYPEDLRLQYRFLDLRRETLHANIMKRL